MNGANLIVKDLPNGGAYSNNLHTCVQLKTDAPTRTNNDFACWGWDDSGQLGDGARYNHWIPPTNTVRSLRYDPNPKIVIGIPIP